MHTAASYARSTWLLNAPMPRLIPPYGGAVSWPLSTRGYSAQPMSSRSEDGKVPSSTPAFVADQTNGQFTMNEPLSPWNTDIDAFSSCVGRPGPPSPSLPMVPMIVAAASPAGVSSPSLTSSAGASGFSRICPPPDATSALIHTVSDSALVPWTPRYLSWSLAAVMIWSHVTGPAAGSSPAAFATDLRYQSSCVFAQNGTDTSLSSHVAPARAPATTFSLTRCATSSGTGARNPGSAISGMNGGSRLMMSIEESLAA